MALQRVTGLWAKDGKRGTFWSGNTREEIPKGVGLMLFENDDRENDDDPEFYLSYANDDDDGDKKSRSRSSSRGKSRRSRRDED